VISVLSEFDFISINIKTCYFKATMCRLQVKPRVISYFLFNFTAITESSKTLSLCTANSPSISDDDLEAVLEILGPPGAEDLYPTSIYSSQLLSHSRGMALLPVCYSNFFVSPNT